MLITECHEHSAVPHLSAERRPIEALAKSSDGRRIFQASNRIPFQRRACAGRPTDMSAESERSSGASPRGGAARRPNAHSRTAVIETRSESRLAAHFSIAYLSASSPRRSRSWRSSPEGGPWRLSFTPASERALSCRAGSSQRARLHIGPAGANRSARAPVGTEIDSSICAMIPHGREDESRAGPVGRCCPVGARAVV